MLIKLSDIAILGRQRKVMDPKKLSDLAEDINLHGLYHPIVVRKPFPGEETGGKPLVLSMGGRRLAAHLLLKKEMIEGNLKEDLDPVSAEVVELQENLQREDITFHEQVAARARIFELMKLQNPGTVTTDAAGRNVYKATGVKEVAEAIGIDAGQLSRDLALHEEIKKDPTLKMAASKGAAIRAVAYRNDVSARAAAVRANETSDLAKKLFTADGKTFIRTLPSQSIDLVFCDLPYGIDYFGVMKEGTGSGSIHSVYDDTAETTKDFIADVVPQFVRVVKPTGWIVLFMCYEWHQWLQELLQDACVVHTGSYRALGIDTRADFCDESDGKVPCQFNKPEMPPWLWTRRGRGNHGHWPELHASSRYEMLVVVNGGKAKLMKKPVENVLDFPPFDDERLHAMQKPHDLCKEIIERTTLVGETVLDICMGSGAHLAAAADIGRDFIGCDKNPANLNSALTLVGKYYDPERAAILGRAKAQAAAK